MRAGSVALALGLAACSRTDRWLPFPEPPRASLISIVEGTPATARLHEAGATVSFDAAPDAPVDLLGFDESPEELGLEPGELPFRRTPPGPGESGCQNLAESLFRAAGDGEAWLAVDPGDVPSGVICRRALRLDEECLGFGAAERVTVTTATAGLGVFELLPDGRALLTLDDGRAYAVDRRSAERLPALETQLATLGLPVTAAWIDGRGRYWMGGRLGGLVRLSVTGAELELTPILAAALPDSGPLPGDPRRMFETIAQLSGRDTPDGVELYALTDRFQFLHYREGDLGWTVTPSPVPVVLSYSTVSIAALASGLAMGTFVQVPGVVLYDPAASPSLVTIPDPDPRTERGADFIVADGDTFLVAFKSPDVLVQPSELYRWSDQGWSLVGLLPVSTNPPLTAVKIDRSLLVALTSGNFTLYPTAPSCALRRLSMDGPASLRLSAPDEIAFVERVLLKDAIQVFWQRFTRAP